jgi:hypothetical protein
MADQGSGRNVSRRDLIKKAGLGGAALIGGSLLGAPARDEPAPSAEPDRGAMGWFAAV